MILPSRAALFAIAGTAVVVAALGASLGFALQKAERLERELDASRTQVMDLTNEVDALNLAAEMDEQTALESYEAADLSCRSRIREAVAAVQVPLVNPERVTDETGVCASCDCPSRRLRDIQGAGTATP